MKFLLQWPGLPLKGCLVAFFWLILVNTGFAQHTGPATPDSAALGTVRTAPGAPESPGAYHAEEDDFGTGMAFFALSGAGIVLLVIGAGAVLAAVGVSLVLGLLAVGVLTSSVVVGLHQKSLRKGVKALVIGACSVGGAVAGAPLCWFLNRGLHWFAPDAAAWMGAAVGLLAGLAFAYFAFCLLGRLRLAVLAASARVPHQRQT